MANRWVNLLVDVARSVLSSRSSGSGGAAGGRSGGTTTAPRAASTRRAAPSGGGRRPSATAGSAYPGDYQGVVRAEYSANLDGNPDPGEVVWTWVPYEEDHSQGKDRPVLLVGRDGAWLLALQLTSKDHDRDARQEARDGRYWMDIGSGPWDKQGRPSEIRLNRVIRVAPDAVRREGAVLPKKLFAQVVEAMGQVPR